MAGRFGMLAGLRRALEDAAGRAMASDGGQRVLGWHDQLSPRERIALRLLAAFALALAVYLLVLAPAVSYASRARAHLVEEHALLAWLEANRGAATAQSAARNPSRAEPVAVTVNARAQEHGLAIESIKPAGDTGLRLELRAVPFEAVVRWLHALEQDGIGIDAFTITARAGESGRVDASLTLRG